MRSAGVDELRDFGRGDLDEAHCGVFVSEALEVGAAG